jgi:hypothetical protein
VVGGAAAIESLNAKTLMYMLCIAILIFDISLTPSFLNFHSPLAPACTHSRTHSHTHADRPLSYEVSIDIDKAFGRRTDTLIVYEMNGEQLPRDHGCAQMKTKSK